MALKGEATGEEMTVYDELNDGGKEGEWVRRSKRAGRKAHHHQLRNIQ